LAKSSCFFLNNSSILRSLFKCKKPSLRPGTRVGATPRALRHAAMAVSPGLQGAEKLPLPVQLPKPKARSISVAFWVRPACRYPCQGHNKHFEQTPR
jgi:hypothetical protein